MINVEYHALTICVIRFPLLTTVLSVICVIFLYFVAYLSSYHEKAINALYELAEVLPAICLPHQDGGIPLSAFPNGITSKLVCLFSTLSL